MGMAVTMFERTYTAGSYDIYCVINSRTVAMLRSFTYRIDNTAYTYAQFERLRAANYFKDITGDLEFIQTDFYDCPGVIQYVPLFDIVIAAANEYGAMAAMRLKDINLGAMELDDIVCGKKYNFTASAVIPWTAMDNTTDGMIVNPFTGRESWL